MFKVQTLNAISPTGLNQFQRELYEVTSECLHPDAILVRSQDLHHFIFPETVKVVGRAGAGVNNIPISALTKLGIPIFNTPGANANAVCELVIAGMLLASRNLCDARDYVRHLKGSDSEINTEIEHNKKQFIGFELMGKTLGIIGLGNIGVKVANAAIKLGMRVIGYDPTITVHRAWELSSDVKQAHNIDDLLMRADFVSFHVPLTEDTKNMINAERLMIIKKGAVVLNFSRDGIIENSALNHALNDHRIVAYVTDFPSVQFKNHPHVISLPHLGASTKEAEENCAVMIVKQVSDFLENGTITHSVNFPSIEMPRNQDAFRLAIVNINIPNMVAQVSSKLASAGINIVSLLNKSREEIAYTLIDVNTEIKETLLKEIANIHGVIQVRKLGNP
jgi:D-3-phosphoglycerate dehydrogenase